MPRACDEPGCAATTRAGRYCAAHVRASVRRVGWLERDTRALYGPAWEPLRRAVLAEEPECRRCSRPATEVDHIVEVADGGPVHDRDNLQPLCHRCHATKTRRQQILRARRGQQRAGIAESLIQRRQARLS